MKSDEFVVGCKFVYMGNLFKEEYLREQEVLNILTINGNKSVRCKFLDNDYVHIFDLKDKENFYSYNCVRLDSKYDNGLPMFWETVEFDEK